MCVLVQDIGDVGVLTAEGLSEPCAETTLETGPTLLYSKKIGFVAVKIEYRFHRKSNYLLYFN
jgi:hypothetical protein